jgi:hypothetical protein
MSLIVLVPISSIKSRLVGIRITTGVKTTF